jgi:hypothetical protein
MFWSGLTGLVWYDAICGVELQFKIMMHVCQNRKDLILLIRLASWIGVGLSGFLIVVWDGVWSEVVWGSLVYGGLGRGGVRWSGVVWSSLVWSGLVWSGLVWSGLVWSGLGSR